MNPISHRLGSESFILLILTTTVKPQVNNDIPGTTAYDKSSAGLGKVESLSKSSCLFRCQKGYIITRHFNDDGSTRKEYEGWG